MKSFLINDRNIAAKISKLLILAVPFVFIGVTLDNDFWFVINHGRYLLEHGFTNIEPFTVHEGLAFSFEKWLTCITFYKVYDWFGGWGAIIFMMLVFAVIIWLFYRACLVFSRGNEAVSLVLTAVCMSFLAYSYVRTRPQIFSYAFMIAEMTCLEKYARSGKIKKLWPLPLLSVLYMQFHSTMLLIFFIMMLPYLCDFGFFNFLGVKGSRYKKWPILAAMVVSALTSLINPYGFRSFIYLINSLNDGGLLNNINEVRATGFYDLITITAPVLLSHLAYLMIRIRRCEKFPLRYAFISMGTFAMALYAIRNNAFFLLMGGLVSAWMLRSFKADHVVFPMIKKLAAIIILISGIIEFSYPFNLMRSTYAYNVLDQFAEIHPDTNITMYTDFNCGSYAEWKGFRCYADPRAEVFIKSINGKEDILAEVWDTMHARMSAWKLQEKYNFDYWLVQQGYALDSSIKHDSNYELIVESDGYAIFKYLPNDK